MNQTDISLHDLIIEIHEFDRKLQILEEKYNLRSEDFFELYQAGRLRDEELDEIDEFGRWAAWHRMRARRIAQYDTLKTAFLTEQTQSNGIVLKPYQTLQEVA